MRHIIIVSKDYATSRASLNTTTNQVKKCEFAPVVAPGTPSATRINNLSALVTTMKQLSNVDDGITVIHTIGMTHDFITNGTALYWKMNGNKTNSGADVNPTEMTLWEEFYALWATMCNKVIFKDVASYPSLVKNTKYAVTSEMRAVAQRINELWDEVNAKQAQFEELETADI